MGRKMSFVIRETTSGLKKLQSKQKNIKSEKKVTCLYLLKTGSFKTQKELASHLRIGLRTLETWLNIYRNEGIEKLLSPQRRNKKSKIFTPALHKALEEKLKDSKSPLLGYWHAQQWVKEEHGIEVEYPWLRLYLITRFKTKLKVPRKKDDKAAEAFLKTT